MIRKICLFLLIAVTIGIWPILAQNSGAASEVKTLDLELVSDEEFTQAMDKASDLELINKEDSLAAEAVPSEAAPSNETPANAGQKKATPAGKAPTSAEQAVPAERATPDEIYENEYLLESHRLAKLADEAFSEGDYDASAKYADEAATLAKQSDVYVAIATAKRYIDQAVSSGVSVRYSPEYREAENWYQQSVNARDSEEWDIAIASANMAVELLDGLDASGSAVPPNALPAAYTVRPWYVSKDCFWNIAGFPWVYGNPRQWRVLYNANKSKLDNPNNPNTLEPGTVLDIPSIKGELRQGAWDSGRSYEPLK
jgi:nucleoid-associated protein YgaU